jgi:hypothetical protein
MGSEHMHVCGLQGRGLLHVGQAEACIVHCFGGPRIACQVCSFVLSSCEEEGWAAKYAPGDTSDREHGRCSGQLL